MCEHNNYSNSTHECTNHDATVSHPQSECAEYRCDNCNAVTMSDCTRFTISETGRLELKVAELTKRLEEALSDLSRAGDSLDKSNRLYTKHSERVRALQAKLSDMAIHEVLDIDVARELAEVMGIDLEFQYHATVEVQLVFNVSSPIWYDYELADDIKQALSHAEIDPSLIEVEVKQLGIDN